MSTAETPTPERPVAPRRLAAAAIFVSLIVVVAAERDIAVRDAGEIRGPKPLWRLGATNALVALAYLRWGRRG